MKVEIFASKKESYDYVYYAPIYILLAKTIARLEANDITITVENIEYALCTWFDGLVGQVNLVEGVYDKDRLSRNANVKFLDNNKDNLFAATTGLMAILDSIK